MPLMDMPPYAPCSLLAALVLLIPEAAQAACPVLDDLHAGVSLVQNAPFFRRADFQIAKAGLMETRQDRSGTGPRKSVIFLGHGLAPFSEVIAGQLVLRDFDGGLEQLDRLDALGEVVLTGRDVAPDGKSAPVALRLEWLGAARMDLGECGYDVWRVARTRLGGGGTEARAELHFAPALGLVLAEYEIAADGAARQVYAYSWAGTEADVRR